jgi:hypothetical protein
LQKLKTVGFDRSKGDIPLIVEECLSFLENNHAEMEEGE